MPCKNNLLYIPNLSGNIAFFNVPFISYFRLLVDSYQKKKVSAVKFVEFSKICAYSNVTSKKIRQEMDFIEKSTILTADILVFW